MWRRRNNNNVPVLISEFHITSLNFWWSATTEILEEVIIVGVLLQKSGYRVDLFKNFVIIAIRPRASFFNGVLGAIDGGWTQGAVIDMTMQVLLSTIGGYMALLGALSANATISIAYPSWWKVYIAGGFLASVPTTFLLGVFGIALAIFIICCLIPPAWGYILVAAGAIVALVVSVVGFLLVLLFLELGILFRNWFAKMRKRTKRVAFIEYSLRESNKLTVLYFVGLFVCLILTIGSWMFWIGFLRLSGELYCPQELSLFDLVILGFASQKALFRQLLSLASPQERDASDEQPLNHL